MLLFRIFILIARLYVLPMDLAVLCFTTLICFTLNVYIRCSITNVGIRIHYVSMYIYMLCDKVLIYKRILYDKTWLVIFS